MNYLKLIRAFWRKHKQEPFVGNEAMLYLRLVDLFSDEGDSDVWPDTVRFADGLICAATGISPNTLDKYRKTLIGRGLILVSPTGKGYRKGAEYRLINTYSYSKSEELKAGSSSKTSSKSEELLEELRGQVPQEVPQKHPQNLRNSLIYIEPKPINLQTQQLQQPADAGTLTELGEENGVDSLEEKQEEKAPLIPPTPPEPFGHPAGPFVPPTVRTVESVRQELLTSDTHLRIARERAKLLRPESEQADYQALVSEYIEQQQGSVEPGQPVFTSQSKPHKHFQFWLLKKADILKSQSHANANRTPKAANFAGRTSRQSGPKIPLAVPDATRKSPRAGFNRPVGGGE